MGVSGRLRTILCSYKKITACMFSKVPQLMCFALFWGFCVWFEVKHTVDQTLYERNCVLALSGRTRRVLSVLVEESEQGTRDSSRWEWRAGIFKEWGIRPEQRESLWRYAIPELWQPLYWSSRERYRLARVSALTSVSFGLKCSTMQSTAHFFLNDRPSYIQYTYC